MAHRDYRDWADIFYLDRDESKLQAYSRIFNTAEINSTFYRYPEPGVVFGWSRFTPKDFKFAVKLNRLITHEKRLDLSKGVQNDLMRFCKHIGALMLALSDDTARGMLEGIKRQQWEFFMRSTFSAFTHLYSSHYLLLSRE